jgi:hypothetical protein
VLAIGDGANDAVMLIQTGLSIAYNAKKNWIGWPMLRCQRRISSIFFICRELLKKNRRSNVLQGYRRNSAFENTATPSQYYC